MAGARSQSLRSIEPASVLLVAAVGAVAVLLAYLMEFGSYDTFAAILVAVGLGAVSVPMLRRAAALESDPVIVRLLWIALPLKLVAGLVRYAVAFSVYDGQADAAAYHRVGGDLARQFRDGDFVVELGRQVQGTGFIQILTGAIYTVIGATSVGGFLVYAWLGFWGLYLFHRAFTRACPGGDHRRYALLVLLLPSLLFWPSSIGKEAWMTLCLGVAAYGAGRVLTRVRGGVILMALGLAGLGAVRPHIAAIMGTAVAAAHLLPGRRVGRRVGKVAPIARVVSIVVIAAGAYLGVQQLEGYFGLDQFDAEAIELTRNEVVRRTGQGGSFVEGQGTNSGVRALPGAVFDVLYRPLPWEANNAQALVAATEGVFLLGLTLTGIRRLARAARSALAVPYLAMCGVYVCLFAYGFSTFSNFGILTRQRVQVLPFLLVLLCMPLRATAHEPRHRVQPSGTRRPAMLG